ncbi:hypothetical protein H9P43_005369 [Blastocladiella emersonii ATCC 22665]|nr:hypothetical protein H9P43_005369 [Blastocladiella emersonii ATCC 22665]
MTQPRRRRRPDPTPSPPPSPPAPRPRLRLADTIGVPSRSFVCPPPPDPALPLHKQRAASVSRFQAELDDIYFRYSHQFEDDVEIDLHDDDAVYEDESGSGFLSQPGRYAFGTLARGRDADAVEEEEPASASDCGEEAGSAAEDDDAASGTPESGSSSGDDDDAHSGSDSDDSDILVSMRPRAAAPSAALRTYEDNEAHLVGLIAELHHQHMPNAPRVPAPRPPRRASRNRPIILPPNAGPVPQSERFDELVDGPPMTLVLPSPPCSSSTLVLGDTVVATSPPAPRKRARAADAPAAADAVNKRQRLDPTSFAALVALRSPPGAPRRTFPDFVIPIGDPQAEIAAAVTAHRRKSQESAAAPASSPAGPSAFLAPAPAPAPAAVAPAPAPRGRGRPRRNTQANAAAAFAAAVSPAPASVQDSDHLAPAVPAPVAAAKRGRGRPRRVPQPSVATAAAVVNTGSAAEPSPVSDAAHVPAAFQGSNALAPAAAPAPAVPAPAAPAKRGPGPQFQPYCQ